MDERALIRHFLRLPPEATTEEVRQRLGGTRLPSFLEPDLPFGGVLLALVEYVYQVGPTLGTLSTAMKSVEDLLPTLEVATAADKPISERLRAIVSARTAVETIRAAVDQAHTARQRLSEARIPDDNGQAPEQVFEPITLYAGARLPVTAAQS